MSHLVTMSDMEFLIFVLILMLLLLMIMVKLILFISNLDCDLLLYFFQMFGKRVKTLEGKVCWITGAGSGIGKELALLLSKNGVRLVISDIDHRRLQEVKRLCLSSGLLKDSDVLTLCFDIRHTDKHNSLLSEVLSHFKRLDIVVMNAGRSQRASFADIDIEVDRQLFDINVFGPISLSRQVLKYFVANQIKGQFMVTSSAAGKMGEHDQFLKINLPIIVGE